MTHQRLAATPTLEFLGYVRYDEELSPVYRANFLFPFKGAQEFLAAAFNSAWTNMEYTMTYRSVEVQFDVWSDCKTTSEAY